MSEFNYKQRPPDNRKEFEREFDAYYGKGSFKALEESILYGEGEEEPVGLIKTTEEKK